MSDRLTAAGEALVAEVHGTTMSLVVFPARIRAIETEAAARAVDEALSVVKGWLTTIGVDIDGNRCLCESRYAPWDGAHRPDCMWDVAAALVAHLRGDR